MSRTATATATNTNWQHEQRTFKLTPFNTCGQHTAHPAPARRPGQKGVACYHLSIAKGTLPIGGNGQCGVGQVK